MAISVPWETESPYESLLVSLISDCKELPGQEAGSDGEMRWAWAQFGHSSDNIMDTVVSWKAGHEPKNGAVAVHRF